MNIFQSLKQRARARRLTQFHEMYEATQAAKNWTAATCPRCGTPAASPTALFCAQCGHGFHQASIQPQEQTTGPILASERPFLAFVHQQHKDIGPRTEEHRAVRLVPLGKGEWK
jgi:ribosomal protein L37E